MVLFRRLPFSFRRLWLLCKQRLITGTLKTFAWVDLLHILREYFHTSSFGWCSTAHIIGRGKGDWLSEVWRKRNALYVERLRGALRSAERLWGALRNNERLRGALRSNERLWGALRSNERLWRTLWSNERLWGAPRSNERLRGAQRSSERLLDHQTIDCSTRLFRERVTICSS